MPGILDDLHTAKRLRASPEFVGVVVGDEARFAAAYQRDRRGQPGDCTNLANRTSAEWWPGDGQLFMDMPDKKK